MLFPSESDTELLSGLVAVTGDTGLERRLCEVSVKDPEVPVGDTVATDDAVTRTVTELVILSVMVVRLLVSPRELDGVPVAPPGLSAVELP